MEFLTNIGRGAASFLSNPIVSTVSGALSLVNAVRSFTGGSESAASGQTGAMQQGDPRFANVPQNIASGQETAGSGESGQFFPVFSPNYSNVAVPPQFAQTPMQGNILAPLTQIGGNILKQLPRQLPNIGLGAGAGIVASSLMDGTSNPTPFNRITRKLRSQMRSLYNMSGMDLDQTAALASSIFGVNITRDDVAFILMKRFRNDGALVTKAAMRKTKKTLNALKRADDLLKMARPAATRRRSGVTQRVTKVSA